MILHKSDWIGPNSQRLFYTYLTHSESELFVWFIMSRFILSSTAIIVIFNLWTSFELINYWNLYTVQIKWKKHLRRHVYILFRLTFHLFIYLMLLYNQSLAVLTSLTLPSVVCFFHSVHFSLSLSIHPSMHDDRRASDCRNVKRTFYIDRNVLVEGRMCKISVTDLLEVWTLWRSSPMWRSTNKSVHMHSVYRAQRETNTVKTSPWDYILIKMAQGFTQKLIKFEYEKKAARSDMWMGKKTLFGKKLLISNPVSNTVACLWFDLNPLICIIIEKCHALVLITHCTSGQKWSCFIIKREE